MKEIVKLNQEVSIANSIIETGKTVDHRITKLNIDNLVATDESIKSIKTTLAELRKEIKEYTSQMTQMKKKILSPFDDLKDIYKEHVHDKYNSAITKLVKKQDDFTQKVLSEKRANVKKTYDELCIVEEIDFISFEKFLENNDLDIQISKTESSYITKAKKYLKSINDSLELIKTEEYQAEILIEFKETLEIQQSIVTVRNRKKKELEEKNRIRSERFSKRYLEMIELGFKYDEKCKKFISDLAIPTDFNMEWDHIGDLKENDYIEFKSQLKSMFKAPDNKATVIESPEEKQVNVVNMPINPLLEGVKKPEPSTVNVPQVEQIVQASFTIKSTESKIRKLVEYMKTNNIEYKALKI